ncbi:hypothetical protein MMC16_006614 [Acarospora aff. strigata]|nr:hypothetical protein [Acarospora aff. strigata]
MALSSETQSDETEDDDVTEVSCSTTGTPSSEDHEEERTPRMKHSAVALREQVRQSRTPKKRQRHVRNTEYEDDVLPILAELQLQLRFYYLLCFSNKCCDSVIREVYGQAIDETSKPYDLARLRVLEICKKWKNKGIDKMIDHVESVILIEANGKRNLYHCSTDRAIAQFFYNYYSPANFAYVFQFMHKCVDLAKSTPTAEFFCRNIYANLAAQCVLHVCWRENGCVGVEHNKMAINKFWDTMVQADCFSNIDPLDFTRIPRGILHSLNSKKKVAVLPDV